MSNYENLVKLRRMIAEFKIYINRTQTYLAPLQLFMIFLIFLNTTVWNLSAIQVFFGSKLNLIVAGTVIFIAGVLTIGYIDTKLKMFRAEIGRGNTPDRNPTISFFPLWTALLLNEKNANKKDIEEIEKMLEPMMKETGTYDHYLKFKKISRNMSKVVR